MPRAVYISLPHFPLALLTEFDLNHFSFHLLSPSQSVQSISTIPDPDFQF